jgi:hypothetical protein
LGIRQRIVSSVSIILNWIARGTGNVGVPHITSDAIHLKRFNNYL